MDFQEGIRERPFRWIEHYPSGREHRTHVTGAFAKWDGLISGVPQGSVFGTLLFLMYIKDLPEGLDSHLKLLVGDAKVMIEVRKDQDFISLQRNLDKFQSWLDT